MSLFVRISAKKREQLFLEAVQILNHAVFELTISEQMHQKLYSCLNSLYRFEVPVLKPRTIVAALFLETRKNFGLYFGIQKLAEATGCSREWLKELKSRLLGPYQEIRLKMRPDVL